MHHCHCHMPHYAPHCPRCCPSCCPCCHHGHCRPQYQYHRKEGADYERDAIKERIEALKDELKAMEERLAALAESKPCGEGERG